MKNEKIRKVLRGIGLILLWLVAALAFIMLWRNIVYALYWIADINLIWNYSGGDGEKKETLGIAIGFLIAATIAAISMFTYARLTQPKTPSRRLLYLVPILGALLVAYTTITNLGLQHRAQWECPVTRNGADGVTVPECCALFTTGCNGDLCKPGQNQNALYYKTEYYCSTEFERENSKRKTPLHRNLVSICTTAPHCIRLKTPSDEQSCSTKMVDY